MYGAVNLYALKQTKNVGALCKSSSDNPSAPCVDVCRSGETASLLNMVHTPEAITDMSPGCEALTWGAELVKAHLDDLIKQIFKL